MTPVRIDYVAPPRTSRGQSLWIQPGDTFLMDRQGSRPGRVLFAREVNLSGFTDTQIVAEFEHWLKETRRAFGIAAPVARGKSITKDAEILADLSWMRLVAQYAKDEIPRVVTPSRYAALSAIFQPRRGQVFSAEEVYRTIRDKRRHDARDHFGKIFERNGVHCDPASWKTWYERQSAPLL